MILQESPCPGSFPEWTKETTVSMQAAQKSFPTLFVEIVWLMLLFIEKFVTHTSPHKYFRPPLLNKHTKASQDATHSSQIRSSKLKTCRSGKHEF